MGFTGHLAYRHDLDRTLEQDVLFAEIISLPLAVPTAEMQRRLEVLSRSLTAELAEPLKIGIGAHAGVAIVGTMGPPEAPIYSAIGDNINIAARFEGMTKAYGCVLVVSADTLAHAGLEPRGAPAHRVKVRGRSERLTVYAVADPRSLFAE
jgi:adenylate cyclase